MFMLDVHVLDSGIFTRLVSRLFNVTYGLFEAVDLLKKSFVQSRAVLYAFIAPGHFLRQCFDHFRQNSILFLKFLNPVFED